MFELPLKPVGSKNRSGSSAETGLDDSHINWGQVITLLIFASNFAVKAVECNALDKVDEIITWLTHFIDTDLSFWLAKQGGWVSECPIFFLSLNFNYYKCFNNFGVFCCLNL